MPRVEIYTKAFCPYCARATALLDRKGIAYDEHDITMGGPKRAEMISRSDGRTTVPQVFVGEAHVVQGPAVSLEPVGNYDEPRIKGAIASAQSAIIWTAPAPSGWRPSASRSGCALNQL